MQTYTKKIKIINIKDGGVALFVDCYINNKKAFMLIDTGASSSIFDANSKKLSDIKLKAKKAECYSLNSSDITIMTGKIEKFKIGKFTVPIKTAIFSPLDYINSIFYEKKMNLIDGILGADFLKKYKAIIDFDKKNLTLKKQ